MTLDLDAVLAAEVAGEPIPVTVKGKKYKLHADMPWNTARLVGTGDAHAAFASLVVEGDADAFAKAMLDGNPPWSVFDDDGKLVGGVSYRMNQIYATGESAASQRSSTNGGRRSRPTSNASTTSTPAAP